MNLTTIEEILTFPIRDGDRRNVMAGRKFDGEYSYE